MSETEEPLASAEEIIANLRHRLKECVRWARSLKRPQVVEAIHMDSFSAIMAACEEAAKSEFTPEDLQFMVEDENSNADRAFVGLRAEHFGAAHTRLSKLAEQLQQHGLDINEVLNRPGVRPVPREQ